MDKFGKYEIEQLVHEDARGRVYRAEDTSLVRPVLLRVLPEALTAGRIRSFYAAIQPVLQLEHPNVLEIFEIGEISGQAFVASAPFDGSRLSQVWGDNLTLEVRLQIGLGTLRALAAAHQAGISHGDLRVDDVLISKAGEIKVENFGLARFEADTRNPAAILALGQPLQPDDDRDRIGAVRLIQALFGSPASGGLDRTGYPVEIQEILEKLLNSVCSNPERDLADLAAELEQACQQLSAARESTLQAVQLDTAALEQLLTPGWLSEVEQLLVQEQFSSRLEAVTNSSGDFSQAAFPDLEQRRVQVAQLLEEINRFLDQYRDDPPPSASQAEPETVQTATPLAAAEEDQRASKERADQIVGSVIEELFEEARSSSTDGQADRCEANLNLILRLDPVNPSARQLLGQAKDQTGKETEKKEAGKRRFRVGYAAVLVPVLLVCLVGLGLWEIRRAEPEAVPAQLTAPRADPVGIWVDQNMKARLYRFRLRLPEVLECLNDFERSGQKGKAAVYRDEIRRYYAERARSHEGAGNLRLAIENYRVLVEMLGMTEFEGKLTELQAKGEGEF